jgi:SAM-dependent methyltransferase
MKNEAQWQPTKFVFRNDAWVANTDAASVSVSSRLNVNLLARAMGQLIPAHARGHLLDLGCGTVPLYAVYKPLVASIFCVDWPDSPHSITHADLACDLSAPTPLEDGCADTVILTDVLEHVAAPARLLGEIHRLLRPGGKLIASVPFLYRLHEEPYDYHRFTRFAIQRMADQVGLKVVLLNAYGGGLDVVFDSFAKVIVDVHWRLGPMLAAGAQRFGEWFRDTRWAERLMAQQEGMPIGYIFVLEKPAI